MKTLTQKGIYTPNVHNSIIYSTQDMKKDMSINGLIDEDVVLYIYIYNIYDTDIYV